MQYARLTLPLTRQKKREAEEPLFQQLPPMLPEIQWTNEPRRLLEPGPFENQPDVMALHFVTGCAHACPFCPDRQCGSPSEIRLAADAAQRVDDELSRLPRKPRAVFISPNTDPFPPLNEVQNTTAALVEVLASHGIESWLMTRGTIRPAAMEVLQRHSNLVKVTVAMTTLDRQLQRLLEPLTAPPRLRLRTLRRLNEAGIGVQAALEPLLPGVTDTRENMQPLLEALEEVGVRQVSVGYMVLHPRTEGDLMAALQTVGLDALVADEFTRGTTLSRNRGVAGRYLPRARRQHGYAALMAMTAGLGMRVSINALSNPDFTVARKPTRQVSVLVN